MRPASELALGIERILLLQQSEKKGVLLLELAGELALKTRSERLLKSLTLKWAQSKILLLETRRVAQAIEALSVKLIELPAVAQLTQKRVAKRVVARETVLPQVVVLLLEERQVRPQKPLLESALKGAAGVELLLLAQSALLETVTERLLFDATLAKTRAKSRELSAERRPRIRCVRAPERWPVLIVIRPSIRHRNQRYQPNYNALVYYFITCVFLLVRLT